MKLESYQFNETECMNNNLENKLEELEAPHKYSYPSTKSQAQGTTFHDNNIEFLHFLYVLKFKVDIEHQICQMNNTTQTFNKFVFLYDQMWYHIYISWNKVVYYKIKEHSMATYKN